MQLCGKLSILWHCLSLELEGKLTFANPVATAEFSKFAGILSAALSQHHLSGCETAQLEFQVRFSIVKFTGDLDKSCLDWGGVCILIRVGSVMNEMKENEDSIDSSFSYKL